MKKTVRDIDVASKRVLVRVDFNVPLDEGGVADDTRIKAALPTIRYLIGEGARTILCSHLGRPKGKVVEELRLDPVAGRLSELLDQEVIKLDDCVGLEVEEAVGKLERGQVMLLENTRFHPEERENDPEFAQALASLAELYVNDAFAAAHRAHASTEGVAHDLPAVAGLLMERELEALTQVRENPEHPFVAVFGGAKISDKIGVIDQLWDRLERLLIGGGMANTFFKAQGLEVGDSLVEDDSLDVAKEILARSGGKMVLPLDVVAATEISEDARRQTVPPDQVPAGWKILDIGPRTIEAFREALKGAKMAIWNGPLGVFEVAPFAEGTLAIAQAMAELDATTVTGGGETAAAINEAGLANRMTHVSTGGGAFLEFMEGRELPGVAALEDA
jgi:phosphoglycerate kinase